MPIEIRLKPGVKKKMGRPNYTKSGTMKSPKETMSDRFRMEERRRLMNKKRDNLPGGMVAGAAVSIGRKNKDKIKKKISDIGNMKVKDAAKKIGSGIGALTPIGIAKSIGSRMKDRITNRDKKNIRENIREKIRKGKIRPIPMPKIPEMKPLGKMKRPRPGTYDYQLLQTQKPGYKVAPMLTGGQAKLDKNKNGRIDAQDFKILKAEKAKGRGQGLQDEKMKPGKIKKAALGALVAGLSASKKMKKKKMAPVAMGGIGLGMAKAEAIKKILGRNKGGMGDATKYKKYLKGLKDVKDKTDLKKSKFMQRRMQLGGARAMQAAKATRIGKIAAGVAGAALLGKAALEKMYEKRTGKKPFTKRPQKKMGGGMMMRPNPVGYKTGKSVKVKCKLGRNKPTKMY